LLISYDQGSAVARPRSSGPDEKKRGRKKGEFKHRLLFPPLVAFFSIYGRLIYLTSRVRVVTPIPKDLAEGPVVIASWHQQIFMVPAISRPIRSGLLALVADSRAGRIVRAVASRFNIDTVSGSSRRGGKEGARSMIAAAREGRSLYITPDGSSGPAFVAKRGATKIAHLSGVPLVPCAAWPLRGKTLATWDKCRIPYPFNTIVVAYGEPLQDPAPEELGAILDALTHKVRETTPPRP
jgi:lysophospholipid acyltransferase (LPLAT)-like uncharacterized protein